MSWKDRLIGGLTPERFHEHLALWLHEQMVARLKGKASPTEKDRQRLRFYEERIRVWKRRK